MQLDTSKLVLLPLMLLLLTGVVSALNCYSCYSQLTDPKYMVAMSYDWTTGAVAVDNSVPVSYCQLYTCPSQLDACILINHANYRQQSCYQMSLCLQQKAYGAISGANITCCQGIDCNAASAQQSSLVLIGLVSLSLLLIHNLWPNF